MKHTKRTAFIIFMVVMILFCGFDIYIGLVSPYYHTVHYLKSYIKEHGVLPSSDNDLWEWIEKESTGTISPFHVLYGIPAGDLEIRDRGLIYKKTGEPCPIVYGGKYAFFDILFGWRYKSVSLELFELMQAAEKEKKNISDATAFDLAIIRHVRENESKVMAFTFGKFLLFSLLGCGIVAFILRDVIKARYEFSLPWGRAYGIVLAAHLISSCLYFLTGYILSYFHREGLFAIIVPVLVCLTWGIFCGRLIQMPGKSRIGIAKGLVVSLATFFWTVSATLLVLGVMASFRVF